MATVKPYDLTRPKGLDRNDLRTLRAQFNNFARHAGIELSALLRRNCTISLTGDVEATWHEVSEMLDRRPYLGLFTLPPLFGSAVFAVSRETAVRLLEFRLGGGKRPTYGSYGSFTDCDYSIVGSVLSGILAALATTFAKHKRLAPSLGRQIADTSVQDLVPQSDMFLVGCFNLTLGEDKPAEMFVALPFPLVHQLSEAMRTGETVALAEQASVSGARVMTVSLRVDLTLPPIELTPEAVAALDVGDVIRLRHPLSRPLELTADGVPVAKARIGRSHSRLACVIVPSEPPAGEPSAL
jgi:flagellar motor switch protein FliM